MRLLDERLELAAEVRGALARSLATFVPLEDPREPARDDDADHPDAGRPDEPHAA